MAIPLTRELAHLLAARIEARLLDDASVEATVVNFPSIGQNALVHVSGADMHIIEHNIIKSAPDFDQYCMLVADHVVSQLTALADDPEGEAAKSYVALSVRSCEELPNQTERNRIYSSIVGIRRI